MTTQTQTEQTGWRHSRPLANFAMLAAGTVAVTCFKAMDVFITGGQPLPAAACGAGYSLGLMGLINCAAWRLQQTLGIEPSPVSAFKGCAERYGKPAVAIAAAGLIGMNAALGWNMARVYGGFQEIEQAVDSLRALELKVQKLASQPRSQP